MSRIPPPENREPCPACGDVGPLMAHLRRVHGFSVTRARLAAARILSRERLSPGDCARLGIDPLPVKRNGALSRVAARSEAPGALPSDAELDAVIRAAGFTA